MVKPCGSQKVRDCLTYFINLYGAVEVDDDGYIRFENGELLRRPHKGKQTPVLVFQDPLPKERFYLLNPFAGVVKTDPPVKWLFNMMTFGLASVMATTIRVAVGIALINRKVDIGMKVDTELLSNDAYLKVLSGKTSNKKAVASEIDETMFHEMQAICDSPDVIGTLCEFHYKGATLSTEFRSPLLEKGESYFDDKKTRRQIRPKTRRVFIRAFENLLGIEDASDLKKFKAEAADDEAVRFGSWVRCQFKVLRAIMPKVEYIVPHRAIDLEAYDLWIEQLASVTARARTVVDSYFEAPAQQQPIMNQPTPQPQNYTQQQNPAPQPSQPQPMAQTQGYPAYQQGFTAQQTPQATGYALPSSSTAGGASLPPPQQTLAYPGAQTPTSMFQNNYPQSGYQQGYQQGYGQPDFSGNATGQWSVQQPPMGVNSTPPWAMTPGTFR